jgi:hypothetical protein
MKTVAIFFFLVVGSFAINDESCYMNLLPDVGNVSNDKLKNCPEAQIFWNYPDSNLTVLFSAPKLKPFKLCLINSNEIKYDILVYRVVGKQNSLVVKSNNNVCMHSDRLTKTVTLKFVGTGKPKYYGVLIEYSIQ